MKPPRTTTTVTILAAKQKRKIPGQIPWERHQAEKPKKAQTNVLQKQKKKLNHHK
jgi:hypothetical protein